MQHVFFCDGNKKQISWAIQTNDSITHQNREHVDMYKNKVTDEQSKYIALHVGIFWAIGVYIIKNNDDVKIMLDSKSMYENLVNNKHSTDSLIRSRTGFFKQLVKQRKLNLEYEFIDTNKNLACKK